VLLVLPAPAAVAAPARVIAPGGDLRSAPLVLSEGPPNGDLGAGLEGWIVEGRDAPALLGPGARLVGNVTLVSPPLVLPDTAQTLRVALRAAGAGGLVAVRARTDDGAPDLALATLEPGRTRRSFAVAVGSLAGRTVRIVLDPVPALGTSLDVLRVGPVTSALPGWVVQRGTVDVSGAGRHRALRVTGAALGLRSPAFPIVSGPRRRAVSIAVRGTGTVSLTAAGRTAVGRAGTTWRRVEILLPRRPRTRLALGVVATPGSGALELRELGLVRIPGRSAGSGSR
jgi:hypothetical protein